MTRAAIRSTAALGGLLLLVAGCAAKASGTTSKGVVPIGVDIELSGPSAVQGAAYKNALQLMATDINKTGVLGRKIKLYYEDNKSDPTEALTAAKDLVQNKHVVAVVGGGSSPTTLSLVDYMDSAHVPAVSMGSSGAITRNPANGTVRPYVFKTPADTQQMVNVAAQDWQQHGYTKIGVLTVDNAYGEAGLAAVGAVAGQDKLTLVDKEKFAPDDKDLTIEARRLAAASPQAIWVSAIPPGSGLAAQAFKNVGYQGQVYFDAGAGAELFVQGAGQAAEGMLMVHPKILAANQLAATTPVSIAQKSWFKQYSQAYGNYSGFASYAADALKMITLAVQNSSSLDPQKIRAALERLDYDGLTGTYKMSAANHSGLQSDALTILTVRDGGWVLAH